MLWIFIRRVLRSAEGKTALSGAAGFSGQAHAFGSAQQKTALKNRRFPSAPAAVLRLNAVALSPERTCPYGESVRFPLLFS